MSSDKTVTIKQYGDNASELLALGTTSAIYALATCQFNDQLVMPLVHSMYAEGAVFGLVFATLVGGVFKRAKGVVASLAVAAGVIMGACASGVATQMTRGNDFYAAENAHIYTI